MAAGKLTQVTSVNGAFRAGVLKARLESCGIDARLTGAADGVYGDMARVDVYVPEEQLDDARYVLLAGEVDAAMAAPSEWWDAGVEPRRRARWPWIVALTLVLVAVLTPVLALFLRDW
jgi:Putative prokaryotic signal transducing protein